MDSIVHDFSVTNVFYDFNKATLRPESYPALDSLSGFMKDNQAITVEIYSHTDAIGGDAYNKELSQKRAESVVDYLEKNGVDRGRMVAKGFGKAIPAAPNTIKGKDNPEGRQLNRRTEFRIVTDIPTRHILFNSAKPGTMNEQEKNLQINENLYGDDDTKGAQDTESDMGKQGSRVNK